MVDTGTVDSTDRTLLMFDIDDVRARKSCGEIAKACD
jgi:hypothetical protein